MDVVQPGDVFQQEETTEVVPTMAINDDVVLRRHDIESEIIPMEVLQSVRGVEAKGVIDDAFICDDEDGLMREGDNTDEEYDLQSDFDTDVDELSLAVVQPSIWCDDCISIVCGSQKVQASDITCGPGHGISFGSLGSGKSVGHVSDVVVNGVWIKTWQSILVVLLLGVKLLGCYAAGLYSHLIQLTIPEICNYFIKALTRPNPDNREVYGLKKVRDLIWHRGSVKSICSHPTNPVYSCDTNLIQNTKHCSSIRHQADWKMVPGLKTGRLRKKTLTQPKTDSPAAIPLGSPVAPSRVLPVPSNVGPSHNATSQPMVDSDETQAPSETQPSGVGTSKPLRVRGPTRGKGIQKIIRAKKGEKCYVHIDRGLNTMTGKYATPATNELGIQIRTLCPLKDVKSWLDLDETTKAAVIQGVLDKFQIGDDFHNDLQAQEIVNKKAYGLYKDWRYTLKQEFELLEGLLRDEIYAHPPVGVSLDNWKHLIDVAWQDASHQKRSKAGKSNRSQLLYNHTNRSRSFPIAMATMVAKNGELDFPKFYEDSHTSKKTNDWIHSKCHELHQEMVNVQAAAIDGPQPSTIFASRAHDKDMEAMRAEVEALREERQKDHDELMKEREERERCYNELLKEREERIQLSNEIILIT
ncbi:unnamed protein product [Camellia sinensis]